MIYYKQESYDIIGAAFDVYNKLGHGFLEAVYQECLEIEFKKRGIPYEREKDIKIFYDGIELTQSYRADFVCYDKISLCLPAGPYATDEDVKYIVDCIREAIV